MAANPWTLVPAADYESHMGPQGADQLAPLSAILGKAQRRRELRLLLAGKATGRQDDERQHKKSAPHATRSARDTPRRITSSPRSAASSLSVVLLSA